MNSDRFSVSRKGEGDQSIEAIYTRSVEDSESFVTLENYDWDEEYYPNGLAFDPGTKTGISRLRMRHCICSTAQRLKTLVQSGTADLLTARPGTMTDTTTTTTTTSSPTDRRNCGVRMRTAKMGWSVPRVSSQ